MRRLPFMIALVAGVLLATMAPPGSEANDHTAKTYLFLGNDSIPPMIFLEKGKPAGIIADLAHALAERAGISIEIRAMDWAEAQDRMLRGEADALLQINSNPEREKVFDFSAPLLESRFSIFRKDTRLDIQGIDSLHGRVVGVEEQGYPIQLMNKHPEIQTRIIPNWKTGFERINAGELDAVVVDRWVGEYELTIHEIHGIISVVEPVETSWSAIAVRKGDAELLAHIDAGLKAIRDDGTFEAILDRWRHKEIVYLTRGQLNTWFIASGVGLVVILLLMASLFLFLKSRRLRSMVRQRTGELDTVNRELHDTIRRLQQAEEVAHIGHWSYRASDGVIHWSDGLWRIFGRKPRSETLSYEKFTRWIRKDFRNYHDERMESMLRLRPGEELGEFIYCLERPDGENRWVEVFLETEFDDHGGPLSFFGTVQDITERRSHELLVQEVNRELQNFVYVASHDLQEPLRTMNNYAEFLKEDLKEACLDDAVREDLRFITGAAARMQTLVQDLLAYSRSGRLEVEGKPVSLNDAMEAARENLRTVIEESGARIAVGDLPRVQGNGAALTSVLQNLLGNAVKFHRPGVAPEIEISAEPEGDRWRIRITDNGIGMEEKYLERIFQPFNRLHGKKAYPGSGLGLAIARKIIEKHGGVIRAESTLDQGSSFILTLPGWTGEETRGSVAVTKEEQS